MWQKHVLIMLLLCNKLNSYFKARLYLRFIAFHILFVWLSWYCDRLVIVHQAWSFSAPFILLTSFDPLSFYCWLSPKSTAQNDRPLPGSPSPSPSLTLICLHKILYLYFFSSVFFFLKWGRALASFPILSWCYSPVGGLAGVCFVCHLIYSVL